MVKVKIQFKSTSSMIGYGGQRGLKDGDCRELEVDDANRLCKDFPKNFSIVKTGIEEKKPQQPETKKDAGPPLFDKSRKPPEKDK